MKNRIDELIDFLGFKKENPFGLHESSKKIAYHQRNFSAMLEGRDADITPICTEIVPSIRCNLNCPSCTYRQNGSKELAKKAIEEGIVNGLMSEEVFDSVVSGLKSLDVKSAIITGGGEPSVNPKYIQFMKKLENSGISFALYSNATRTGRDAYKILGLNPEFIRLSLNSGDSTTHSLMYGAYNLFRVVVENIIKVGKAKQAIRGCKTTLGLGFIMGPRNSASWQLESIKKTLERITNETGCGVDYAAFRPEVQYFRKDPKTGRNGICKEHANAELFRALPARIEEAIKEPIEKLGIDVLIAKDGFDYLSQPYKDGPNIAAPWSVSINYDGKLHLASEGNGNPDYCASSEAAESIENAWNSLKKAEIIARLASKPSEQGHIPNFPHYKLMTTNSLLLAIRDKFGTFSPEEVRTFYKSIDISNPPKHVNFI